MKFLKHIIIWSLLISLFPTVSFAEVGFVKGWYVDTRFQGDYSTNNIDEILAEYELKNGWYWTTKENEIQTFHGSPYPGWTDTSVNVNKKKGYNKGWYGYRWALTEPIEMITSKNKNPESSRGECFGFAEFIGYLLSGNRYPQYSVSKKGEWKRYDSLDAAGGLRVGDIVRIGTHSAIVYKISGDKVTFIQAFGGSFNRLYIDTGFNSSKKGSSSSLNELKKKIKYIARSPKNVGDIENVDSKTSSSSQVNTSIPANTCIGVWATANLNIRSKPSSQSEWLGSEKTGTYFDALEIVSSLEGGKDWYKITYNGQEAYISTSFASPQRPSKKEEKKQLEQYYDNSIVSSDEEYTQEITTPQKTVTTKTGTSPTN